MELKKIGHRNINTDTIKTLLDAINTSKACGPDEIPGIVLKTCSNTLAFLLSIIYKLVYNTGSVPLQWKLSNIVPIFKKGENKIVSNYRPVSLLCIASKIMEKIIHEELLLKVVPLINKRQHGFLPNRSCATNLMILIDNITKSLHNNTGTDIIYFDFAKAFDSVSHDLIPHKLKTKFKIDGRLLKFIQDYLRHRKQREVLDVYSSEPQGSILGPSEVLDVHSGVPQGSILGPSEVLDVHSGVPQGLILGPSEVLDVHSGVPQGSILGPLLSEVLDVHSGVSSV